MGQAMRNTCACARPTPSSPPHSPGVISSRPAAAASAMLCESLCVLAECHPLTVLAVNIMICWTSSNGMLRQGASCMLLLLEWL